jgi:mannosylfructose-phosphate synthase
LYIAGGSSYGDSKEEEITKKGLDDLIRKYKMEKNVSFFGYVDHDKILPAIYRNSNLFILAGRYEPFGLTTLEAMACGVTPIVSKVAGSKEVIIDGLNGYTVDTSDKEELSQVILEIMTNKKLQKKISANAAFTIKEHYSWNRISNKFIKLYTDLLK